jgi:uncharacterized alkaline shock family protein YloU
MLTEAEGVTLHVGDAAAARIAAVAARGVPGVVSLRADLAQALLGVAGAVFGQDRAGVLSADGVSAQVHGGAADVTVTIVTRLGDNCRDVAIAVQKAVTAALAGQAGLDAQVRVTVADVLLT